MAELDRGPEFAELGGRALMRRMHDQVDELLAGHDQMDRLLRVIVDIGSDLSLDSTLHRIAVAAKEVTQARYAALAVRAPDSTLLSFVHAGIDDDVVRLIGHLPVGKGVLGVPIDENAALRLDDLTAHPATAGFPDHHPPMSAFVGMPITIRGVAFGTLYVTDDAPQRQFSDADEIAVRALASAAATAIDNAQLFERVQMSARWTEASREITTVLLGGSQPTVPAMQLIAERARELTGAEQAIVLVPTDDDVPDAEVDSLVVDTAVGVHVEDVLGQRIPVDGSTTGEVFRSGSPLITEAFRHPIQAFTDVGQRPAIVMPLCANDSVLGVIAVARNDSQPPFDDSYLDLVSDFARHAAMALTLSNARERQHELTVLGDRERIAHDLHDHVIQRLFAAGMDLQGTIARSRSPEVVDRLSRTVDDLQATINDIRNTIFELQAGNDAGSTFRGRVERLIADLTDNRNLIAELRTSGPLSVVGVDLSRHAEAVITEAISNCVRHADASRLTVRVTAADFLAVEVVDNGRGIPPENTRRSGLSNIRQRAEQLGGTCEFSTPPDGGTQVRWSVPLTDD
jgi:signal transduction histidine kinase